MKRRISGRKIVKLFLNCIIILFFTFLLLGCSSSSSTKIWAEGKPKHHTINGYRNFPVVPDPPPVGVAFYLRRFWGSFVLPDVPPDHFLSEDKAIEQYQQTKGQDSITWLGHDTFLININGLTILTDPFLTEYASPFWHFGPRRYVQPGISLDNLPPINVIIVSHNHLDHLDAESVEKMREKENIRVFVPLGLRQFFTERGYKTVHELDWDESHSYSGLQFTALPAVHYSGRSATDKNETLWCSWSITSTAGKYYFSGDSSYSSSIFKNIGKNYGPFDFAMISIGAYKTRKHGPASHFTPEEAIIVAKEIEAPVILGTHWGTIELSDEPPWEPPIRFKKAALENGFSSDQAWIMKIGETRLLPSEKESVSISK